MPSPGIVGQGGLRKRPAGEELWPTLAGWAAATTAKAAGYRPAE